MNYRTALEHGSANKGLRIHFPISQETHCVHIAKTCQLSLFASAIHGTHKSSEEQRAEFLNTNAGATHDYEGALCD
jgi:hypothetical protein